MEVRKKQIVLFKRAWRWDTVDEQPHGRDGGLGGKKAQMSGEAHGVKESMLIKEREEKKFRLPE